jgi:hypothetical protein
VIALLSWNRVVVMLAKLYAATVVLWLLFTTHNGDLNLGSVAAALRGGAVLDLAVLLAMHVWWRRVWRWFPVLNRVLFPDLNGTWNVEIRWCWGQRTGVAVARAHIKQDLAKLSMHLRSDKSESDTLVAIPKKDAESGLALLYYVYRNTPKFFPGSDAAPYEGTASLRIDHDRLDLLEGNYFTSAGTKGVLVMTKAPGNSPSWVQS